MERLTVQKISNARGNIAVESRGVFSFGLHTHTYYEMILYEPFLGHVTVNGCDITVDSITAVLISPDSLHEIKVADGGAARYIKIGFNAELLDTPVAGHSLMLDGIEREGFLYALFEEMLKNSQSKPYLAHLIGCAVYAITCKGKKLFCVEGTRESDTAAAALRLINAHFKEDITLASTARLLSVTPPYLSRCFRQSYGTAFSSYLVTVRLKYAASMMESTGESITVICYEAGFGNLSHFSRSFKRLYGVSPREYRHQMRAGRS